jgi:hypothetical protein
MWRIDGNPLTDENPAGGWDGTWHKWPLARADERSFTMVKITRHAEMKTGGFMTQRSIQAVDTRGGSEVERYLDTDAHPPRVIETGTMRDPVATPR